MYLIRSSSYEVYILFFGSIVYNRAIEFEGLNSPKVFGLVII